MANIEKLNTFIAENLRETPVVECPFVVGESVIIENGYGVVYQQFKVIGFDEPDAARGNAHIYLDWGCYWFAIESDRIYKRDNLAPFFRIYSPSLGYLAIDYNRDHTWIADPAKAELFSRKVVESAAPEKVLKTVLYGETEGIDDAKYLPALECKLHVN